MSNPARILTMILVAALVSTATAKEPKIGQQAPRIPAKSWDGKNDVDNILDNYQEHIIVLFFFRNDDAASLEAIPILNDLHDELGEKGLVIIGVTFDAGKKGKHSQPRRSKSRRSKNDDSKDEDTNSKPEPKFHVLYGTRTISRYDLTAFPRVYLIDPTGVLVNHFHPTDRMEERIRYQFQKTPPVGMDPARLRSLLAQADQLFNDEEYGKAFTVVNGVLRIAEDKSDLAEQATEKRKQIVDAANRWLADALRAARDDEYDKVCRILAEISVRFEGQDVGERAETEMGRLMGDREWKTRLRVAVENARGEILNDRAAAYEEDNRYLYAIKLYRETTDEYPDTKASREARKAIERINDNPVAQREIKVMRAEDQADRWLDIGDRYARGHMYARAREYYQRIIDLAGETRAFDRAKERLETLPEPEPEEDEKADKDEAGSEDENGADQDGEKAEDSGEKKG